VAGHHPLLLARDPHLARSCSSEQVLSIGPKRKHFTVTIIEIRPFRNGWQAYEAPGVQPVVPGQRAGD